MRAERKLHIVLFLFAAILTGLMTAMMWMGGEVNLQEFMSADMVYDFDPAVLEKSSSSWLYDQDKNGYRITSDKAAKNFSISSMEQTWNYLYITIDKLSSASLEGMLRYYDSENAVAFEQSITLDEGSNVISLAKSVPLVKIRITLLDAKGQFISISDMQIRTTPSVFTVPYFWTLFVPALAGSLAVLTALVFAFRRFYSGARGKSRNSDKFAVFDILQDAVQLTGDALGSRMGGKLTAFQKESLRTLLFCLMFVWMTVGNVLGWIRDEEIFRYHVLICTVILSVISLVSWEKPLEKRNWRLPLMRIWFGIWFGVALCDFFVERELESIVGYSMMFAGTVFLFFWQNMESPGRMFCNLLRALEITFFIGVLYCMIFRLKIPAIDYNGIFRSPEELSMYAVLMAIVFLTEMDWLILDSTGAYSEKMKIESAAGGMVFPSIVKYVTGLALSLFLAISSAHISGIAALIIIGILYLPLLAANIKHMIFRCRKLLAYIAGAVLMALLSIYAVDFSTQYLPGLLDVDMQYQDELLLSEVNGEEQEKLLGQDMETMTEIKEKQKEKLLIIWRNYARRLNLFGHDGTLKVFRRTIPAYNGYLDMAFHHGIFILIPYAAYQIAMILRGTEYAFRRNGRRNICILFLGIAYLCFSVCANVEVSWGHPLWLCYYLSVGHLAGSGRKLCKD